MVYCCLSSSPPLCSAPSPPCCFFILFIVFGYSSAFLLPHRNSWPGPFSCSACVLKCVCVSQIFAIEGSLNTSVCWDRNRSDSPSKASKDMTHICFSLCSYVRQCCLHSSREDGKGEKKFTRASLPAHTMIFGMTSETQRRVGCSAGCRQQGANFLQTGDNGALW